MKSERQNKIRELVSKFEIETQDEMMSLLKEEGFEVTQATVSRDLREMKLSKTLTARGTYRYCIGSGSTHMSANVRLGSAMADSILTVEYAMNNVVLKTYPGMAQGVALGVDALNHPDILGCVAGDDTIIIVTRGEKSSAEVSEKIRELMKSF